MEDAGKRDQMFLVNISPRFQRLWPVYFFFLIVNSGPDVNARSSSYICLRLSLIGNPSHLV